MYQLVLLATLAEVALTVSDGPLIGLLRPPGQHIVLARLDPLSLTPLPPSIPIGEYHFAWSFSPDRSGLAVATGGRGIGIRIVDLPSMAVRHEVQTGIAAEALGWLAPSRLVAALQDGDLVVVDTESGVVVRRKPLPLRVDSHAGPQPAAFTARGLVVLLQDPDGLSPARLVLADAEGDFRAATLDEIQVGVRPSLRGHLPERAGFAIDASRERAFLMAAGGPLAEVDMETMSVRYHRLAETLSLDPRCPTASVEGAGLGGCSSTRAATWLGGDKLAFFGADLTVSQTGRLTRVPAGVVVLDTEDWTGYTVEGASEAISAGDRLLVFGGAANAGVGLRAYGLDGRLLFHLFGAELVSDVYLAGGQAYARCAQVVRLVEPRSGEVIREIDRQGWFELLGDASR